MLFTCATLHKTNPIFIHSSHTDIYLRNTCIFPSATVHVMHNFNITVLSPEAAVMNIICHRVATASSGTAAWSITCPHTPVGYVQSQCHRTLPWLKPDVWHSLVFIINLLLGKGSLGVLLQGVAYPGEGVHLLGTAGRHGDLIAGERTSRVMRMWLYSSSSLTRLKSCLLIQVERHQRQRGPAAHGSTYSLSLGQQFLLLSSTS